MVGTRLASNSLSLQNIGRGGHPTPEWCPSCHVDLPIFSLFCPLLSFLPFPSIPFFFFLFSPFPFWRPFSEPGGRSPQNPPPPLRYLETSFSHKPILVTILYQTIQKGNTGRAKSCPYRYVTRRENLFRPKVKCEYFALGMPANVDL